MRLLVVLVMLLSSSPSGSCATIKSKFSKATSGDFIVTQQKGIYSILLIRSVDASHLVLEEISVQPQTIDLKTIQWKKWVANGAPGAVSWSAMAFDLNTGKLTQCYSYLEKQWFFIDESDYFVKQLFEMPLRPTKESERKRIGSPPHPGEIDRRRLWKPRLIREGKQEKSAGFEVLRAKWPADKSKLAGCIFEFYFDVKAFPFPYWMEVQHPHYTFKIRTLDSGRGMQSPMPLLGSRR